MNFQELIVPLAQIDTLSALIYQANRDNKVLFDAIEAQPQSAKEELKKKYAHGHGPVNGIRQKLVKELIPGPVNRDLISKLFESSKRSDPKRYLPYKNLYSILYPFLTHTNNNLVYKTLEYLAELLQNDLKLKDKTDVKCFGFDGARNTGNDRCWFAIYNNTHPTQKTAKQLFLSITNRMVEYALYDRSKDKMEPSIIIDLASLDYAHLLAHFSKYKDEILQDNFRADILAKYPTGALLEKIRTGSIKAWLIKPGERGNMWKQALKEDNLRIGWGNVIEDMFEQNNFQDDFILELLDEYYKNGSASQTNNKNSIKSFVQDIKENDIVFAVSGTSDIIGLGIVTGPIETDEEEEEFKAFHNMDWLVDLHKKPYKPGTGLPIKTVTEAVADAAIQYITDILEYKVPPVTETSSTPLPFINTILYGPPGTGKTFHLNKLKEACFTDKALPKTTADLLQEAVSEYPFWKILAVVLDTFDQPVSVSELLEQPLVKLKLNPQSTVHRNTIWRSLQSYADDSSTELADKYKGSMQIFHKHEDSKWSIIPAKKRELEDIIDPKLFQLAANPANPDRPSVLIATPKIRYTFITFHQKYSYEDFIEGIRPLLRKEEDDQAGDLQFELKKGVFYQSCLKALELLGPKSFEEYEKLSTKEKEELFAKAKEPARQYALFIDEINRANISAVFGELITLLEHDKRLGTENEMWLELPYSRKRFCVPANLYIIGTMNTADRSIALVDIALRRRFEFKPMYPEYNDEQWYTPLLKALNKAIYDHRKNPDFFIGHAFFMHQPENQRTHILNTKIIPLLQEYCQNNTDAVLRILQAAKINTLPLDISNNFQIIAE